MKKLLSLLLLVLTTSCGVTVYIDDSTRQIDNFTYNDGQVTWSKIYNVDSTQMADVRSWFESSFAIKKTEDTRMIGQTNPASLPMEQAGLRPGTVVMMFHQPCIVYFVVDFKEDRYRVVVTDIVWNIQASTYINGVSFGAGTSTLSEVAIKGEGYNSIFYDGTSKDLNKMLKYVFQYKQRTVVNHDFGDNW